ncbi:MAG: DUF1844 domain-containing protein [Deltaproteobacteria bacterium]|jgi:hypothetical protein|nr:DUF1844 domain-containing protein [Deltaproteobacteria bacterium]
MSGPESNDDLEDNDAPAIDFNTFVLSLSASALVDMGAIAVDGVKAEKNLPLARHTIECLVLLERKTAGNLTGEEERLLAHVLDDLRAKYRAAGG